MDYLNSSRSLRDRHTSFLHGTSIVVLAKSDSLLIAADSKVCAFSDSASGHFTNMNKIYRLSDRAYFSSCGIVGDTAGHFSVEREVRRVFSEEKSLERTAAQLRITFTPLLKTLMNELRTASFAEFKKQFRPPGVLSIVMISYENNPECHVLTFHPHDDENDINISVNQLPSPPFGNVFNICRLGNQGYKPQLNAAKDSHEAVDIAKRLIAGEIELAPDEVGFPIDAVVLSRQGERHFHFDR